MWNRQDVHWNDPDSWWLTQLFVQAEENWSGNVTTVDMEGKKNIWYEVILIQLEQEEIKTPPRNTELGKKTQMVVCF